MVLDREEQLRRRLIEAPAEKMRGTDYSERVADTSARAKAQRGFDMLDRNIRLTRP